MPWAAPEHCSECDLVGASAISTICVRSAQRCRTILSIHMATVLRCAPGPAFAPGLASTTTKKNHLKLLFNKTESFQQCILWHENEHCLLSINNKKECMSAK